MLACQHPRGATLAPACLHLLRSAAHAGISAGSCWTAPQAVSSHSKLRPTVTHCCATARALCWHQAQRGPQPSRPSRQVYQSPLHSASVNSLCWAPYELGLVLAAASSDGSLSVLTYQPDGSWHADKVGDMPCLPPCARGSRRLAWQCMPCQAIEAACLHALCSVPCRRTRFPPLPASALGVAPTLCSCPHTCRAPQVDGAHPVGCTAVSWAPAAPKGSLVASKAPGQPVRRLASCGADNCVKVRSGRMPGAGAARPPGGSAGAGPWLRLLVWLEAGVKQLVRCPAVFHPLLFNAGHGPLPPPAGRCGCTTSRRGSGCRTA